MSERSIPAESFNARFLDAGQVGSNFVLSPHLERAIAPENTAILGPRGSGKTTLLKMLTLPALLRWPDPHRDAIAGALDYLAVYVPYSLTWSADYRGFSSKPLPDEVNELLSVSLFRHNVLLSFLETWRECAKPATLEHEHLKKFFLPVEASRESELAKHLARLWELELPISTINGIREAINSRLRGIQRIIIQASRVGIDLKKTLEENHYLAANFFDDAKAFTHFLGENYSFDRRIALCFDELEIASDAIATAVLRAPRSIPEFYIKFCAAPYVGAASFLEGPNVATQYNDFSVVFLSSFSQTETRPFSESLFRAMCQKRRVTADPEIVLGPSLVDDARPPRRDYAPDGNRQRKFESLYRSDRSFREYIERRRLNIKDLSGGTEFSRAAAVRKIIWPVLIREEFLKIERNDIQSERRRLRSKDLVSDIYTGSASLFSLCEGNPRSLIGLTESMIDLYAPKTDGTSGAAVPRSFQKNQIEKLISGYFALLSTVPSAYAFHKIESLLDLVYIVGESFKESVLRSSFNPDPVLSFHVDQKVPEAVRALVGKGVNLGAFISTHKRVKTDMHFKVGDIVGLKIRLSNIFAPHFRLPLIGGRSINLSTILRRPTLSELSPTLQLFGDRI